MPPRVPRLLAISPGHGSIEGLEAWLAGLSGSGVDAVQLREKGLADRAVLALARRARALLPQGVAVLVNGRADVALAAGCDGVHLPAAELPAAALRQRFGDALLIGRSTHDPEEVAAARRDGADYATFGPIFPTPGKLRYGDPPGLAGLTRAAARGLPVLALGGVGPEEMPAVAAAGAAGAAAIRALAEPENRRRMVAAAQRLWREPQA